MERRKLALLVILGVGLFALMARRARAAAAPAMTYYAPEGAAPTYPATAPATGSQGWPSLDWGFLDYWTGDGEGAAQSEPVSQAPGGGIDWAAEFEQSYGGTAEMPAPVDESTPYYFDWVAPLPAPTPTYGGDIWGSIPTYPTGGATVSPDANVAAFLKLIRTSEGTENNGRGWNPYGVTYSYAFEITDFRDHPSALGWRGVTLPDSYCRAAGLSPGCVSTAAGAYQFISTTWRGLKTKAGLPDFSPASQDAAAVELLRQIGALDLIRSGQLQAALDRAATQWASLPGSQSGQPQINIATASQIYQQAGGSIA